MSIVNILKEGKVGKLDKKFCEMSFEECSKNEKIMNDVIKRWKRIGLTEGLDENIAKECSFCYEKMALYLINNKDLENFDETFELRVFPMIRRVLREVGTFNSGFNPEDLEKFYYSNIDESFKIAKQIKGDNITDEEADAVCILCDNYIKKLKDHGED